MPSIEELKPKKLVHRSQEGMRSFTLYRESDESGVSGTGVVLEGVIFSCGTCVVHWLTPAPSGSIAIWGSFREFIAVHCIPHPTNKSVITYEDGVQENY